MWTVHRLIHIVIYVNSWDHGLTDQSHFLSRCWVWSPNQLPFINKTEPCSYVILGSWQLIDTYLYWHILHMSLMQVQRQLVWLMLLYALKAMLRRAVWLWMTVVVLMLTEFASGSWTRDGETSSETSRAADEETREAGTTTACTGSGDESQTRSTQVRNIACWV